MGNPAAKQGDQVTATDIHMVIIPGAPPPPSPLPHPFTGIIDGNLSQDVIIEGKPAAYEGSTATNTPAHIPSGGSFQKPPSNSATIVLASQTVKINGKGAARNGDVAETCNDPADLPVGSVIAAGTVMIGG